MPNPTVPADTTALPAACREGSRSDEAGHLSDKRILALANELERNPDVWAARTYDALMRAVRQATIGTVTGESLEVLVELLHSRQMARPCRGPLKQGAA